MSWAVSSSGAPRSPVLSDIAEFCYKCDDFYHPGDEGGILWNAPEIGIEWPQVAGECLTDGTPLNLSERDRKWPGIRSLMG